MHSARPLPMPSLNSDRLARSGPWDTVRNCSCLACDVTTETADGLGAMHCCADNGASLSHGSWLASAPGNADMAACREQCGRTAGCTHYSFSTASQTCASELSEKSRGFGRCGLCGACTQRGGRATPAWQKSYLSFELDGAPVTAGSHSLGALSHGGGRHANGNANARHHRHGDESNLIPAVIISGCDRRYERAAAVARAAGFAPTWLVGVFRQNVAAVPGCPWPSQNERNLLSAHRNAWSLIASTNTSMAVLEDDIELGTSAAAIRRDVLACDASYRGEADADGTACQLLYLGYVDAYWATHAPYIAPSAAKKLLRASGRHCPEPTDYHTHRFCLAPSTERLATWHVARNLSTNCRAFSPSVSGTLEPLAHRRQHAAFRSQSLRSSELYGMGHLLQNRTRGYIHKLAGFGLVEGTSDGQGANC